MRYTSVIFLLILGIILSGCYHAQITTGQAASSQVVEKPWASSFIGGLVPPQIVNVASECPSGVAKVETKLSFLNMVVSALTFSIYTPMHITVTCAATRAELPSDVNIIDLASSEVENDVRDQVFADAVSLSKTLNEPVFISFK